MTDKNGMNLWMLQTIYIVGGIAIVPFAPFLYLLGRYTRWKVGVLPGAAGDTMGVTTNEGEPVRLLVMGESTVAGLGARTHELALAGQFAQRLGKQIYRPVHWTVIGKNGVTARQTIDELVPQVPDETFDYILLGLGGNDVLKLSSPRKWRRDMTELVGILRTKSPAAAIFVTNCPMINLSPALPHPIKFILWQLSRLHDANIREFSGDMDRVFYYHQPTSVTKGFFADGIHPSEKGYADWSEAMMKFFAENYKW
jgi:Lysophospholipase L1 and related esterases